MVPFYCGGFSQWVGMDIWLVEVCWLEKLLHNKGNINKVKRQALEWEKIIANEETDKGLISKNIQATPAAQFQKNK